VEAGGAWRVSGIVAEKKNEPTSRSETRLVLDDETASELLMIERRIVV
jgi:hypothetical protein